MYERFTDRARMVMQLANQEAQRFNHEYIGTEHILLGLRKERCSVAANVLKRFDLDLRPLRSEVERIVPGGSDVVTTAQLPLMAQAQNVVEFSIKEAHRLNDEYVETEHLLLGLLRQEDSVAAQILRNLGVKLKNVRKEILNILRA
jgi:ATP-dependent Clp protease ATP-binding subunit ClpC